MLRLLVVLVLLLSQQNLLAQHGETAVETQPIPKPGHESSAKAKEPVAVEQEDGADHQPTILQRLERLETFVETAQSKQQGQRNPDHEVRDLQAQETMAFWTAPMFWASGVTVVLTFAALLALIRTLHHTRRAADYAKDMTDEAKATTEAAVKSLALTESHGRAQLRAYVTLKEAAVPESVPDGYLGVKLVIENCGQTPAFIHRMRSTVRATNGPIMKSDIEVDGHDEPYRAVIGAGHSKEIYAGNTTQRIPGFYESVKKGQMSVVAHLRIEYTDIFATEHTSVFTRVMEGGVNIPGGLGLKSGFPDQVT